MPQGSPYKPGSPLWSGSGFLWACTRHNCCNTDQTLGIIPRELKPPLEISLPLVAARMDQLGVVPVVNERLDPVFRHEYPVLEKSHSHVFLGELDPGGAPPKKPFVNVETNLIIFVFILKLKVHFLKVIRVITLAPHEVHPYHSTERSNLPSRR